MSEIPDGWEKRQLHQLLEVPKKDKEKTPKAVELLTVKLHGQGVVKSGKFPKPTINGRPYFRRYSGELLIGRQNLHNGGLGLVTKETTGLISSNAISSFINKETSDIHFIHQLLSTEAFQNEVDTLSSGTGQKETSEKQILSCNIVAPSLPEQKKIASILTSVDDTIENIQKQIDKLQDLKKATMNELLTKGIGHTEFKDSELGRIPERWEASKLGKIGDFSKGKGISKSETVPKGIPCIRYAEIYTDYDFVIKNFKSFISQDTVPTTKKLKINDMIFAGSGETAEDIGKSVAFISECEAYVGGDAIILSPYAEVDSAFLAYQLNDEIRRKQLRKLGQGSSIIHIYSSGLEELDIVLPPLLEQKKIASILTSIDDAIGHKQNKLHKTQSLKRALMQDLLTGKVRVKAANNVR